MDTPIVFIIFNRPARARVVFEKIREAQPRHLYVVADGPRPERDGEAALCAAARAIIDEVDWPCEVHRNFSDLNQGCGRRIVSGLDWVFSEVESAIVLEDDCVPHRSFFGFCEELLKYYQHDERVMQISGNNFQRGYRAGAHSYYFSKYPHTWGWATWRRAWQHFDYRLTRWPEIRDSGYLRSLHPDPREYDWWVKIFDSLLAPQRGIWDYQWIFACWMQGGLSVLPEVNLVSNIGIGADATHTPGDSPNMNVPVHEIGPISHPTSMLRPPVAEARGYEFCFGGPPPPPRLKRLASSVKWRVASGLSLAHQIGLGALSIFSRE